VRVVPEQVAPGQPQVLCRIRRLPAQRPERRRRLDREQSALGTLVCLLEVDAGRVDASQDVLEAAADELSLMRRQAFRRGRVLVVAADTELGAERLS
jgi:hypothetical protein